MCVAAIGWHAHPDWALVAIGNRDEFHDRPAAPITNWEDGSGIIAGRDLQSGGTWLGTTNAGRFALVTNLRGYGSADPDMRSRGELVTKLLAGEMSADETAALALDEYNPFNLFMSDGEEARFLSNRPECLSSRLAHGIYGLSNGPFDEPWAKTMQLKSALLDWLNSNEIAQEPLFEALVRDSLDDIGLHPQEPSEISAEAAETPPFIRNPVYGTRCSTIVAVSTKGQGRIAERRFDRQGEISGESFFEFHWRA